ncbi:palmitoyltransferase ZDHHC4 [Geosmithia morbida]|uniref:Palmitoyltransferase n=1 Tax=Geosmithia morbida TaxID=1094350 RepID=A0A9P4YTD6_9HYPO|nr:palmitoyltransferase ZDHHC4 [Geosmithia morbida]KAF4122187.1 palmitoyltransferase ZDHHC4 [Geosmithia morbida]
MGTLGTVVGVILLISFMTFVTFFGRLPALRNTPISALHRAIWVHLPNGLLALDQRLTSGKLSRHLVRFGRHMLYDRHPTVVIFFAAILVGGELAYLPTAWPVMSGLTRLTSSVAVVLPYVFLWLACAADPGYVTGETVDYHMSLYPYDYAIFHPGRICRTCDLPKPPRSKHCSLCKRCVARADHHCIFINGCVGYGNHHWFVLLLLSTAVLTAYGGLLGMSILSADIRVHHPGWSAWPLSSTLSWTRWCALFAVAIRAYSGLGAATLLSLLTSPLIWGLLLYTLYLIYLGTTTNESLKWSDFQEDVRDGYAFSRPLPQHQRRSVPGDPGWSRWPAQPHHILVTTTDGRPPNTLQGQGTIPGEGPWEPIRSLADVENVYDLGFWDNLRDIFIKDYAFGSKMDVSDAERSHRSNGPWAGERRNRLVAHPP